MKLKAFIIIFKEVSFKPIKTTNFSDFYLLMLKFCGIIGILKFEFFNFSGAEGINILLTLADISHSSIAG